MLCHRDVKYTRSGIEKAYTDHIVDNTSTELIRTLLTVPYLTRCNDKLYALLIT